MNNDGPQAHDADVSDPDAAAPKQSSPEATEPVADKAPSAESIVVKMEVDIPRAEDDVVAIDDDDVVPVDEQATNEPTVECSGDAKADSDATTDASPIGTGECCNSGKSEPAVDDVLPSGEAHSTSEVPTNEADQSSVSLSGVDEKLSDLLSKFESVTANQQGLQKLINDKVVVDGNREADQSAVDEKLSDLLSKFESLTANQQELQKLINEKVVIDANREAVIDRLHAELQEYKQGMIRKIMLPMIMEIIMLYDDVGKSLLAHADKLDDSPVAANLFKLFEGVQEDIENLLYKHDVEAYSCEAEEFDPKLQRPLKPVPTDQPELDRKIADRLRKGFKHDERVIRPEWVSVYKYVSAAEDEQEGDQSDRGNTEPEKSN